MKHILTFLAITVLSVSVTQAATVSWKSGNLTSDGENVPAGVTAYLWTVDEATYTSLQTKSMADVISEYKSKTGSATDSSSDMSAAGLVTVKSTADANETVYGVVFYELKDSGGNTIGELASTATGKVNSKGSNLSVNGIGTTAFANNGNKWSAVPEPTAVALLALGLAALGLKRKVA